MEYTQELMKMMMVKMENNNILSDPFVDQGFMELLGFQEFSTQMLHNTTTYNQPPPSLPIDQENLTVDDQGGEESLSSVVFNVQSPNSCSISSPATANQQHQPLKQCMKEKKTMDGGDETKTKRKKKVKEARFAFLTKSEIDHLDDGYRWRKYGQKAVKNSHFPRSYYRCTSASCNVKKRVERCMGDPSYVVTTYEGQHVHLVTTNVVPQIPSFNRFMNPTPTMTSPGMPKLDQFHYH